MNEKKQIECMARLDGYTYNDGWDAFEDEHGDMFTASLKDDIPCLPAYLTSHDAVQPVIDGLDDFDCSKVFNALYEMYNHKPSIVERSRLVLKATPAQKVEAILKAKGLWEEG